MIRKLSTLAVAATLAGGAALFMGQGPTLPGISIAQAETADVELLPDMVMGDPNAPVEIVEYISYTCGHCANFHNGVFKEIEEKYIDTGIAKVVFREVYFDRYALWAGMISRCAGDASYFPMSDAILGSQAEWIGEGDPTAVLDNLKKIGRIAGMDDAQMETCLQDETMAQRMVATYQAHATKDEVTGTPSFVINGKKYSNMPFSEFEAAIEEAQK